MELTSSPSHDTLPLVSVIIPAYNAARFVQETLESVLGQTYQNLEVLVVDDGSNDNTVNIIEQLAQQDSRIILIQQENAGVAAARNAGILQAKGEFIAPVDADDIWYPEKLAKQVVKMLASPAAVGVVYCWSAMIDEKGQFTGGYFIGKQRGYVLPDLICQFFLGNASVPLIRRSCFETVGLYDQELRAQSAQGAEDYDISLRLAEYYQFEVVPEFLVGYRQVPGSMSYSVGTMERSLALLLQSIRQRHPEFPGAIFRWSQAGVYYWLGFRRKECGDYLGSLWLYGQAMLLDPPVVLKRSQFYKDILINFLSLILPFRMIISYLKEVRRKSRSQAEPLTLAELTASAEKYSPMYFEVYEQRLQTLNLAKPVTITSIN
ncbi:glycosyltransferase family A protein [Thermosynechococcaceae cyanobacterium BACA0444]|uniref:Glycosyltransferase family A protein n=1 Tax=Pseudocalidococcus azoricus BACA0444 TaxID=2918990 RepID=A0AAE4JVM3_9CYAN|nr:glycosyltransferase family A protein [Pseudocalidococcus azoricus]MDS3859213.1 glycosyltransferase family A protein [Pseudocalidococcus azoricus BACA0444]